MTINCTQQGLLLLYPEFIVSSLHVVVDLRGGLLGSFIISWLSHLWIYSMYFSTTP